MSDDPGFPYNIVDALADSFTDVFIGGGASVPGYVDQIAKRRLRPNDPNRTLAIWPDLWTPGVVEMRGQVTLEPTFAPYVVRLDYMNKNTSEETGRREVGTTTKIIRTWLYRDPALQVRLRQVTETLFDVTERVLRWGIVNQRYFDTQLAKQNIYAVFSSTTANFETQI